MGRSALRKGTQHGRQRASHVTIADIARTAQVAKSSASYALNGRPGVADATRQRVVAVAEAMGWRPNCAARALSAARANAVGLVLAQPPEMLGFDTFLLRFIAGLEQELSRHGLALMLRVVADPEAEVEVHRHWSAEHRVDGVLVFNQRMVDPRAPALDRMGLPAIVVGTPDGITPAVWSDDEAAMTAAVEHLVSMGHRRIARVGGNPEFRYTQVRREAFFAAARAMELDPEDVTDSTLRGEAATRDLLGSPRPPTAIVYEDDAGAAAAVIVARQLDYSVPDDLSIVGWDDSLLCELVHPPLTALHRDIFRYGGLCARHLVMVIEGQEPGDLQGTETRLVIRSSTGPPPAGKGRS
ncbi:MAG: LacI family transcriptional regulator [Candidatus Dormibacteraeota bacterium]|nr:LacI family transcriptional regulator [Candidatus Dormibacteraeota bacterium]